LSRQSPASTSVFTSGNHTLLIAIL
jgi:hypothetical protein